MDPAVEKWIEHVLYHCGYLRTDDGLCVGDIREAITDVVFWTIARAAVEGRIGELLMDPKLSEKEVLEIIRLGPQWIEAVEQTLGLRKSANGGVSLPCVLVISYDKQQA